MDIRKQETVAGEDFVVTRLLDAPRELVFRAWTEPERLGQWMSPQGMTTIANRMELRPGGTYHYGLRTPDGHEMWGKWTFREIVVPEKIVFVQTFSDAQGGITRHPMNTGWPLQTLSTITFAAEGNKTRLAIRWAPYEATADEIRVFNDNHPGMTQGWGGTLVQLEAYLAKARA